jgi:NAD(P)-dependent dehydrogenase (short-subunit alcohol dehydrogenase family)
MSKVVVITGASAGVGRATARRFAEEGADVALIARGAAGLDGARREVEALGRRALVLPCDVADPVAVEVAAARVENVLGPIDIWVNCAMATVFGEFIELTPGEFSRVTEVTYLGTVNGTRAALRHMLPRDRGVIIQVGSALAYRAIPLQSAYSAAKHAVAGFTEALRCELLHRKSGIRITAVHLPAMNTPQFAWGRNKTGQRAQPVPPIYQPEVAARAVVYAAAHDRRELWVAGPTLVAILGERIAPGIGDRYLARTGYDSQLLDERRDDEAPDNLFSPVDDDRDFGAHGAFDDRAHARSVELWLSLRRRWIAAFGLAAVAAAVPLAWRSVRRYFSRLTTPSHSGPGSLIRSPLQRSI